MDVRQLRYFVGIAESRSLTEAARRLHIVQPALSQRLSDLEKSLEVQLVVRGHVGTALTPAGTELYEHAKRILKRVQFTDCFQIDFCRAHLSVYGRFLDG